MAYWNDEKPVVANTGRNRLELYPKSMHLNVGRPNWTDKGGIEHHGKTIDLDLEAVCIDPAARKILREVVAMFDRYE